MSFIIYLISINIISFVIVGIDKRRAIRHKWRVSEGTLFTLAFLGGCFGEWLGMYLFRHKTRKIKFKLVGVLCLIWIYGLVYLLK